MKKEIIYHPACIETKSDPKKYYGVTFPNQEKVNSHTHPTRAFIAAWSGYPNPNSFVLICCDKMTCGNTWDKIKDKNDKHERTTLDDFIIYLYREGFKVYEFDNAKEFFVWLSDCETIKKDSGF